MWPHCQGRPCVPRAPPCCSDTHTQGPTSCGLTGQLGCCCYARSLVGQDNLCRWEVNIEENSWEMNESQRQKKTFVHMQAFELSLSKRQSGAESQVGAAAAERQTPAAQARGRRHPGNTWALTHGRQSHTAGYKYMCEHKPHQTRRENQRCTLNKKTQTESQRKDQGAPRTHYQKCLQGCRRRLQARALGERRGLP